MAAAGATLAAGALAGGTAQAQGAPRPTAGPARLRGTLDGVTETGITMITRTGAHLAVALSPQLRVALVAAARIEDIRPNSYIGTAATAPQPDRTLRALEVSVFPPEMRGAAQGHFAWDLGEGTTMTNGTVGSLVGTNGRTMVVSYGNGEKRVVIPDDVPIVMIEPADRVALQPGAKIVLNGQRDASGAVTAAFILVGKDGLTPPM
ncbi:hypothetical protein E2C05_17725 [Paracraurococcus ruber]|uniref:DUF5666 domain-containing protein n=2 Tax=Paracraurococcus ruber TaxID=77675 RepID=A0ABS1CW09_9PROT|nr:hypothetical protein [Paracraurococcus ruber]TDG29461.1 hypothetical protein E2C05_17725 [Paracraurococcus ruber]